MLSIITVLILLFLTLSACGKTEFGLTENTGKLMTIKAVKADRDDFFMVGSLQVDEGEQVVITPDLTKGSVRVELIYEPEEQSIDELPDIDGDPTFTADVSSNKRLSDTVPEGSYLLRATCLEKATGTVQIEVNPAAKSTMN